MNVLVAYASRHGSTRDIAQRIVLRLADHGHEVTARDIEEEEDGSPGGFDAVILGSAVYMGHWIKSARKYLDAHLDQLADRPLYVFSSGPVIRDEHAEEPAEIAELIARLGPVEHVLFGGKLDSDELNFGEKLVVKMIGAEDDDVRDFEVIDRWADAVAEALTKSA
jgi:menaquinone-dependent protoporphyrinogen oxidase